LISNAIAVTGKSILKEDKKLHTYLGWLPSSLTQLRSRLLLLSFFVEVIRLKAEPALAASSFKTVSNISCLPNLHEMKLGAALRRNDDANGVGSRLTRNRWKRTFPRNAIYYFCQWRRFITDYRGQGCSTQKITSTIIRQGW